MLSGSFSQCHSVWLWKSCSTIRYSRDLVLVCYKKLWLKIYIDFHYLFFFLCIWLFYIKFSISMPVNLLLTSSFNILNNLVHIFIDFWMIGLVIISLEVKQYPSLLCFNLLLLGSNHSALLCITPSNVMFTEYFYQFPDNDFHICLSPYWSLVLCQVFL